MHLMKQTQPRRSCLQPLTITAATAFLFLTSCSDETKQAEWKPGESIALFDGMSLDGWSRVLAEGAPAAEEVWMFKGGLIVGTGERAGYLRNDAPFQNFELIVDWTWVTEDEEEVPEGDAGILLRIAADANKTTPKCIEVDLQPGSEGNIWAYRGASLSGDSDILSMDSDDEGLANAVGLERTANAQLRGGESNRCEIILQDGNLEVKINGEVVNQASGLDVVSGQVGLQAAGSGIQFDYVQLTPL